MSPPPSQNPAPDHHVDPPSAWVVRFAGLLPAGATVLDLACGGGRHTRLLLDRGCQVTAVDREASGVSDLTGRAEVIEMDLEDGRPFPLAHRSFGGLIVTNYLYRPLLPALVEAVAPGGLLIYETFARGNEQFGRPRNPDFLLEPGELLALVRGRMQVLAYENLIVDLPKKAAVQRICALNDRK